MDNVVFDDYCFGWRRTARKIGAVLVGLLFICSVVHLFWVSFFIKTEQSFYPGEIFISFILFCCTYLSVFLLWLLTVPFFHKVDDSDKSCALVNYLLYCGIRYVSPFRAGQDTVVPGEVGGVVYKMIIKFYYNDVLVVVFLLFSWFIAMAFLSPSGVSDFFIIDKSNLFYFFSFFVAFYGAGASVVVLMLRVLCKAISGFNINFGVD